MILTNAAGTTSSSFQVGKSGAKIWQGSADPNTLSLAANDGDIYLRQNGALSFIWIRISGTWIEPTFTLENFSYREIPISELVLIPGFQEMTVSNQFRVEGEIDVEGALVVNG
jgi:hypothetical protein